MIMATCAAESSCYLEMLKSFDSLREKNLLCDLTIVSCDGCSFSAHQALIAANSRHFYKQLTALAASATDSGADENNNGDCVMMEPRTVTVEDDSHTFAVLLDYMYTRKPALTIQNIGAVIKAACRYELESLLVHCVSFIRSKLDTSNCVTFLHLANKVNMLDMRHACIAFISNHFGALSRRHEVGNQYEDLSAEDLLELMADDRLNVHSEAELFEAVVAWIKHDPQNRAVYMPRFLQNMRLGLVEMDFFFQNISTNAYVIQYETQCQEVLQSAWQIMFQRESGEVPKLDVANPLFRPRTPCSIIFVVGGWSAGSPTARIEAYDPRAERWYSHPNVEDTSPRSYHGLVTLGGQIYMMGGFDGASYFNTMRRFDPVSAVWHDAAPMYNRRCYVSVCAADDHVYVCGGFDGHTRLNTAERYDPKTNQWTLLPVMNTKRSDAAATFIDGCVYMIGGFNGEQCLSSVEKYSPQTNKWTYVREMSSPRSGVSVVTLQNHIYALGGFGGERRLRSVERYSPTSMRWCDVVDMHTPRSNFAASVLDGRIYVIGGFNGTTTIQDVEYLDPDLNQWYVAPDMNLNRSALRACVIADIPNMVAYTFHGRDGDVTNDDDDVTDEVVLDADASMEWIEDPDLLVAIGSP